MARKLIALFGIVLAVAGALLGVNAQDSAPEPATSESKVWRFSDNGEVENGHSQLTRYENGVTVTLETSELNAGDVYTVWWVIFNNPEGCSDGVCNLDDIFVVEDGAILRDDVGNRVLNFEGIEAAGISVQHAAGNYTMDGSLSASASLGLGSVPGIVFGPGLLDGYTSEVHLVVRTHGPRLDDAFDAQIASFGGGCEPIDTAPCDDVQYAMHMPAAR